MVISIRILGLFLLVSASLISGCSSKPKIQKQEYAVLKAERVFEAELPRVWSAIEASLDEYPIAERRPRRVESAKDWSRTDSRRLKTDWVYSRSRDKYVEYTVNDLPRRQPLQMRFIYEVEASRVMGGTEVKVEIREEIEEIDHKGNSRGYRRTKASEVDSSRQNEILEKIRLNLLR